jgi:hypothetical protein
VAEALVTGPVGGAWFYLLALAVLVATWNIYDDLCEKQEMVLDQKRCVPQR